jgi:hypothetical protein
VGVWSKAVVYYAFGRNLVSIAIKMLHIFYFVNKFYKFCNFNAFCTYNASKNCFMLNTKMFIPVNFDESCVGMVLILISVYKNI